MRIRRILSEQDTHDAGEWKNHISSVAFALGIAACIALSVKLATRAQYSGQDSWFPITQALEFLHSGRPGLLYESLFFSEHVKFQYPPSALLLFDAVRWLGIGTPFVYNSVNVVLLVLTSLVFALLARRLLGTVRLLGIRFPVGPAAFLVALRFYPNRLAFELGQIQILLDLLFLLACLAILRDRRFLAGCLIGAAAAVKPQFLPLALLALWYRDWPFAAGLGLVAAATLALAIAAYGWENQLDYLTVLQFLSRHGEFQHLNQSVNGILGRMLYDGPPLDLDPAGMIPQSLFPPYIPTVYIATTLTGAAMMLLPFALRPPGADPSSRLLRFCTAAILFTMAAPVAWAHHFGVLLPGYLLAMRAMLGGQNVHRALGLPALLALSFLLAAVPLIQMVPSTTIAIQLVQAHVFLGASLLVFILLRETPMTALARANISRSSQTAQLASEAQKSNP